ncbi:MAG: helix-turn-helix transcriptional regulator [Clostridia bacterium]|nr:helix-turn-helix transcriptional regulator [Clostridia bacterium]
MIHFNLEKPVRLAFAGEFNSPERGWKHLTRELTDYELMIVTEGELRIGDENQDYSVRAGEYLIMSPTRFQHGTEECKCRFFWMHFSAPDFPASLSLSPQGKFMDGKRISELMQTLFLAESEQRGGLRSCYLVTELLFELAGRGGLKADETPLGAAQALCERVKALAASRRFTGVQVKEIADELGYHEKYLSAVFRKTEGITLKSYLSKRRTAEARHLLSETDFTVAEIAYFLGFDDPHNFSRFFKHEEGITPSEFRDKRD